MNIYKCRCGNEMNIDLVYNFIKINNLTDGVMIIICANCNKFYAIEPGEAIRPATQKEVNRVAALAAEESRPPLCAN